MMKIWIVLLLITFPIALQRVICDEEGRYSCADDWECCKSPHGGYGCCHQPKACASDGHCYRLNLFSQEKEISNAVPARRIKQVPDVVIIIKNFLKAIGFFEEIPETCDCFKSIKPIVPEVIELVNKIKQIKTAEELIPILLEAYTKLFPKIKAILLECDGVPMEIREMIMDLVVKVTQPDFPAKIVKNVQNNLFMIMASANKGITAIREKEFATAGQAFAEVFKYIFADI